MLFSPIPIVFGIGIGRWWAVPLAALIWPGWLLLNGREIESAGLTFAVINSVSCAVGVWFRLALTEEIEHDREAWKIWWHDRGWRN